LAEVLGRYSKTAQVAERITRIPEARAKSGPRHDHELEWRPHALWRRLSREQLESLAQEYLQGEGSTVLARRYGVSENAVLGQLKREGVALRKPGKLTAEDVGEMQRLRDHGWTYRDIGNRFGVTRVAVSRRLAIASTRVQTGRPHPPDARRGRPTRGGDAG